MRFALILLAAVAVVGCAGVSTRAVYEDSKGVEAVLEAPVADCWEAALSALESRGFEIKSASPAAHRVTGARMREDGTGLSAEVELFVQEPERTRVLVTVERVGSFEIAGRGEAPLILEAIRAGLEEGESGR